MILRREDDLTKVPKGTNVPPAPAPATPPPATPAPADVAPKAAAPVTAALFRKSRRSTER